MGLGCRLAVADGLVPAGWEVEGLRHASLWVERLLTVLAVYRAASPARWGVARRWRSRSRPKRGCGRSNRRLR